MGPATQDQLPGGKEADGIIGDFIKRNNLIEAVIAHNAHLRKANMATNWEELIRNSKRGQILMTNGPFLQVETEDGVIAGGTTRAMGSIYLKVKVQTTDWIDIDRIQILVNSRQRSDLNYTRESHPQMFQDGVVKFDQTLQVPLSEDSHLIVVAYSENSDLETGYGSSWQAEMHPCAYINPIFVDVDGNGYVDPPNGGFSLSPTDD